MAFLVKYSQVLAATGAACVISASFLPQTLGLGRYRSVLANYKNGKEQEVDPNIMAISEKILARMKLTPEDEASLQIFTCFGNDPISKGSLYLRTGAIVGVPPTFYYNTPTDIDTDQLIAGGSRYIDWESQTGIKLAESLILSDRAKAFGLAREIMHSCSYHIYIDGFFRSLFFSLAYCAGFVMNRKFDLRKRLKIWGRVGLYSVFGGIAYALYVMISDTYFCWLDNSSDKRAAKLGWAYAEGGVEFYSKALERNKALREILKDEGAKLYTVYGNDVATFRRSNVQLTERKRALDKYLQEYEEKNK